MSQSFAEQLNQLSPEILKTTPALLPPPGQQSNFENPIDKGHIFVVVGTIEICLTLIFYFARLYTRTFVIRILKWDDVTCAIGVIGSIVVYAGGIMGTTTGPFGKHQWDTTLWEITRQKGFILPSYFSTITIQPTLLFIKASFFLMYLHIFSPMRWLRISVYISLTLLICFYGATSIVQIYFTTPKFGETWLEALFSGSIVKSNILAVPNAAVGLGFDIVILVLPLIVVHQLQLTRARRISMTVIFLTGILACIGSTLSIYYRFLNDKTQDKTWTVFNVVIASNTEIDLGIICLCMPSVSKLLRDRFPKLHLSIRGSRSKAAGAGSGSGIADTTRYGNRNTPRNSHGSGQEGVITGPCYAISEHGFEKMDGETGESYELGQVKTVHSFVRSGVGQVPAPVDDRIRLTREVHMA